MFFRCNWADKVPGHLTNPGFLAKTLKSLTKVGGIMLNLPFATIHVHKSVKRAIIADTGSPVLPLERFSILSVLLRP
jgi:hypothetical protein